jgi:hypothetical protein
MNSSKRAAAISRTAGRPCGRLQRGRRVSAWRILRKSAEQAAESKPGPSDVKLEVSACYGLRDVWLNVGFAVAGYAVDDSQCVEEPRPPLYQQCPAPCPSDCVISPWGAWSPCSHTCGNQSEKVRAKKILRLSMNGGRRCPSEADSNGKQKY